jgi:hypothetical protein
VFSIVGFRKQALPVKDLQTEKSPFIIELSEDVVRLAEVVVETTELSKSKTLGVKEVSGKLFGFIGAEGAGAEISRKMLVSKPSLIRSASIYVRNKRSSDFKLRLNIYTEDQKSGEPGHSLLSQSIILESDVKEGWLIYDFKDDLLVDKPFYVSYEWVESDVQNPLIALKGNHASDNVRVRPISLGKWIMAGSFNFAIRCEILSE